MNTERLQRLMEAHDVNQCKLAEVAGTSQAFICNVLKGYKDPSVAVLKRIAEHLKVPVDELI